jgi:DDE_Tnp_1-associated/Transposase DDE domain
MSTPLSLLAVLAEVPDPRSRHGRRHPLSAILSLAVVAMLSGAKSYQAIAQFGRDQGFALAHLLGFTRGKTPTKSTFSVLFRILDVHAFEQALCRWIASRLPEGQEKRISLDGKTARGSRDGAVPGQHLVAAYYAEAQAVLAQIRVDAKTNEHKAALQLLGILPVKGNIFTGDALFCQRDLCAEIIAAGGDYVFTAKDNQPSLVIDISAGLASQEQAQRLTAAFSPGGVAGRAPGGAGGHDHRKRTRPHREADAADHHDPDEASGLGGLEAGIRAGTGTDGAREEDGGGSSWHHQPQSGARRRQAVAGADPGALGDRK